MESCKELGVNDIADFMNMDEEERGKLVPESALNDMAEFCNAYPSVNVNF